MKRLFAFPIVALVVACGGTSSDSDPPKGTDVASEDERGTTGVPNPASDYCLGLGYTVDASDCVFPDGTRCEQWAFYRAQCGSAHSYCEMHGGSIATAERDAGTYTSVAAVCTVGGKTCDEETFWRTERCD